MRTVRFSALVLCLMLAWSTAGATQYAETSLDGAGNTVLAVIMDTTYPYSDKIHISGSPSILTINTSFDVFNNLFFHSLDVLGNTYTVYGFSNSNISGSGNINCNNLTGISVYVDSAYEDIILFEPSPTPTATPVLTPTPTATPDPYRRKFRYNGTGAHVAEFYLKTGDQLPYYAFQVVDAIDNIIDISATTITARVQNIWSGTQIITDAAVDITDGAAGCAELRWPDASTNTAATYAIEFRIIFVGLQYTLPADYNAIVIIRDRY